MSSLILWNNTQNDLSWIRQWHYVSCDWFFFLTGILMAKKFSVNRAQSGYNHKEWETSINNVFSHPLKQYPQWSRVAETIAVVSQWTMIQWYHNWSTYQYCLLSHPEYTGGDFFVPVRTTPPTCQGQLSCQKWKKSEKSFKNYCVNKNLRPALALAACK